MHKLPAMVDMIRVPEGEAAEDTISPKPFYPYGLSLCFDDKDIEKLQIDTEEVAAGDMFHLFAICKVTSVSKTDASSGKTTRIEMQITHVSAEDESGENQEMDTPQNEPMVGKLYKGT